MDDIYLTIADKYGYRESKRFLTILKKLMTKDEAVLASLLPAQPEYLAAKAGKSVSEIQSSLEKIFVMGVLSQTSKGYRLAKDIVILHDGTSSETRNDALWGDELLDLWKEFSEHEMFGDMAKSIAERPTPIFRVLPVRSSIAEGAKVLPNEDMDVILEKAARFSVVHCPCRRIGRNCDRPQEVCLQLDKSAEYSIKRRTGRELSRAEVKKMLETAAKAGLVPNVPYMSDVNVLICNCCADCWMFLHIFIKYGVLEKGMSKSRFEARVTTETCKGCQKCAEQCQFDAIDIIKVPGEKKMKARVDFDKCYGCGVCSTSCKTGSVKLYEVRPPERIPAPATN